MWSARHSPSVCICNFYAATKMFRLERTGCALMILRRADEIAWSESIARVHDELLEKVAFREEWVGGEWIESREGTREILTTFVSRCGIFPALWNIYGTFLLSDTVHMYRCLEVPSAFE